MALSLEQYAAALDERQLLWPKVPDLIAPKATAYLKPLQGVRGVIWSLYGMLLRISEGRLYVLHPTPLRMQVALEKTIEEFNMWNSMSRKPGQPWEYMLQQITRIVEDRQLAGTGRKGEAPEINSVEVWAKVVERLGKKEYQWDADTLGDEGELCEKIAWFYHSALQGTGAAPHTLATLQSLAGEGVPQGIVGDGQMFSLLQLTRALREPGGRDPRIGDLFLTSLISLSVRTGVRQPAPSLFEPVIDALRRQGLSPREMVYVSPRLKDELAVAKGLGFRTALYAGDKLSVQASHSDVNDPQLRPDRILTEIGQIRQILSPGS